MDWLSGLNGVAGFGATGAVVIAGVLYAIGFQKRFAERMEQQADKDVARIEKLESHLLTSQGEARREREYSAMLRLQIIEAGLTPHPRPEATEST